MEKISVELAEQEINNWLESKKIFEAERVRQKQSVETLVDAVVNGFLTVKEDGDLQHTLLFPIGSEEKAQVKTLTYKKRLAERDTRKALKGVSPSDVEGRMLAYIQALTDEAAGIIGALDTSDSRIAKSIVVFFL